MFEGICAPSNSESLAWQSAVTHSRESNQCKVERRSDECSNCPSSACGIERHKSPDLWPFWSQHWGLWESWRYQRGGGRHERTESDACPSVLYMLRIESFSRLLRHIFYRGRNKDSLVTEIYESPDATGEEVDGTKWLRVMPARLFCICPVLRVASGC